MTGGTPRRDSWDAIAKTKSMLSYGSLESLANLANGSSLFENPAASSSFNNSRNASNNYSASSNALHTENSSSNYTSSHRFVTNERSASPKYSNGTENVNSRSNGATHGILKNKNNNYYKSVDTTDAVHERFTNNGGANFTSTPNSEKRKGSSLVTGNALEMLPIHKPMTFTIDPSIDASKATVTITGKQKKNVFFLQCPSKFIFFPTDFCCLWETRIFPFMNKSIRRKFHINLERIHDEISSSNDFLTFSNTGPNGKQVPFQKSILRGQIYTVTVEEVGEYIIQIMVNGQHVKGSPFR